MHRIIFWHTCLAFINGQIQDKTYKCHYYSKNQKEYPVTPQTTPAGSQALNKPCNNKNSQLSLGTKQRKNFDENNLYPQNLIKSMMQHK